MLFLCIFTFLPLGLGSFVQVSLDLNKTVTTDMHGQWLNKKALLKSGVALQRNR